MEKVGAVESFPENTMIELEVAKKHLLVVNNGGELYVTDARCPHMGGHLARGILDGEIITCPLHGSQFNVATGKVLRWTKYEGLLLDAAEALRHPRTLKTYETAIHGGVLYAEVSDE